MRTFDFTPLYRSAVGFDRLANLLESAARTGTENGWPPYNIETTGENAYRIEIAVAGFGPDELNIEVKENLLTVQGRKAANDESRRFLHRGLAERDFDRRSQLADYVVVTEAKLSDGLLSIALRRELPEALKPRRIEIATGESAPLIEGEKAAGGEGHMGGVAQESRPPQQRAVGGDQAGQIGQRHPVVLGFHQQPHGEDEHDDAGNERQREAGAPAAGTLTIAADVKAAVDGRAQPIELEVAL